MRVIPVIDLKEGRVVRAVAGDRAAYRPVASVLADDPSPRSVAAGLVDRLACREVYVADLDAIAGAEPDWAGLAEIAATGMAIWLDAGIARPDQVGPLLQFAAANAPALRVIQGLESSPEPASLGAVFAELGPERSAFSLDLRHGHPWTASSAWQGFDAEQIAGLAVRIGFAYLIVLDVARVGMAAGPGVEPLCRALRTAHPHIELVAGGGVRDADDLRRLQHSGCDAALVASALHDGRLTKEDMVVGT